MLLGLMSAVAGSTWTTIVQRAKEQELLWRGNQYRQAIESYFVVQHGGAKGLLPSDLESLIKDPRFLETRRHLRKLFTDPITGEDWVLVKDPSGRISGVRSSSTREPFKKSGFSEENQDFEGKESYSEWQFVFDPKKHKDGQAGSSNTQQGTGGSQPQGGTGSGAQGGSGSSTQSPFVESPLSQ